MGTGANTSARELLTLARSTANKIRAAAISPTRRLSYCKKLLSGGVLPEPLAPFSEALAKLDAGARHYWIGTFYSLLLPPAERRHQAVYFTPPRLAEAIVDLLVKEGFDLSRHSVMDPAAGGAAFLSTVANKMASAKIPVATIRKHLHGIEIDSGLARLAEELIADRLEAKIKPQAIVQKGNSLTKRDLGAYDLVIANPPYGRLFQGEPKPKNWRKVCYSGHINKYALFAELCCRLAKPNGLIALVLPSSFIAGPLYDLLRTHLREIGQLLLLGSVPMRQDVFADVAQDVSVVILRKGAQHDAKKPVVIGRFDLLGGFKATTAVHLPELVEAPWTTTARARELPQGGSTLEDYGAKIKVGYFVWNREQERMSRRHYSAAYMPLVWAKNVQVGKFCVPKAKKGSGIDFVRFDEITPAVTQENAIILQRTTNSAQKRRLIAARISPSVLKRWGGFVTENHTLVVTARSFETLTNLCILLNSRAVDLRYRQVSGTASVSALLLRELDLPHPKTLDACLAKYSDTEKAVEEAYAKSGHVTTKAMA